MQLDKPLDVVPMWVLRRKSFFRNRTTLDARARSENRCARLPQELSANTASADLMALRVLPTDFARRTKGSSRPSYRWVTPSTIQHLVWTKQLHGLERDKLPRTSIGHSHIVGECRVPNQYSNKRMLPNWDPKVPRSSSFQAACRFLASSITVLRLRSRSRGTDAAMSVGLKGSESETANGEATTWCTRPQRAPRR